MMKKFLAANAVMLLAVLSEQNAAIAAPISSHNTLATTGHVVCYTRGCRQVRKGCRLEYRTGIAGGPVPTGGNVEVCPHQSAR